MDINEMASELIQIKNRVTGIETRLDKEYPTRLDVYEKQKTIEDKVDRVEMKVDRLDVMLVPFSEMHQSMLRSQGARDARKATLITLGQVIAIAGRSVMLVLSFWALIHYISTH